ncbi:hypothetical protein [Crocosphaera subtropica]|nr:hypothetical protein [Crocosphaera subtropica]
MNNKKNFILFSVFGALLVIIITLINQATEGFLSQFPVINDNNKAIEVDKKETDLEMREEPTRPMNQHSMDNIATLISQSYQEQQTQISLSQYELNRPYTLTIKTSNQGTQLQGEIRLNGRSIQSLNQHQTVINLSPYLQVGKQMIEISGNYTPINDSIIIELKSQNSQTSQTTSGTGQLQQRLIINVE